MSSPGSLAPRVVVVHRRSELDELVDRHGTRGQAEFFLTSRGRSLADVQQRHDRQAAALKEVADAIPIDWRRGAVERDDVSRFLFAPDDIVVAVGQDGLVANVAKYLAGQPVIGVDADPGRNPGVLVPHPASAVRSKLSALGGRRELTMVELDTDDGQSLVALNEVFVGPRTHQTARYRLTAPGEPAEDQASSGLIVATGTGSTGWSRSIWTERRSPLALPAPTDRRLSWFVREAWPSPSTSTDHTEGLLDTEPLQLTVASDQLVCFGDGIEPDALTLSWGQTVTITPAAQTLSLVV